MRSRMILLALSSLNLSSAAGLAAFVGRTSAHECASRVFQPRRHLLNQLPCSEYDQLLRDMAQ